MIYILQIMYYFTPIPGLWENRFSKWTIYDVGNVWQNVLGLVWGCGHDLLPYFTGWNSNWSSSAWGTLVVIKKGRISRPYDLASPSVFFATFSPKEMRKKKTKTRLNSFASVLVSLVCWWNWVGLVGIVRRVVFRMQPLLPLLAVTCSLKKSRSACPMECFNTCLRKICPTLHAVAKMAKNWRNRSLH